jgi:hypothetical protein
MYIEIALVANALITRGGGIVMRRTWIKVRGVPRTKQEMTAHLYKLFEFIIYARLIT